MRWVRAWIPGTILGRTRLAAALLTLIALGGPAAAIGGVTRSLLWDTGAWLALVTLGVVVVATCARGEIWTWEPVAVPVLCLAACSGMDEALAADGLFTAVLLVQSLYGTARAWLLRYGLSVVLLPLAMAPSPAEMLAFDLSGMLTVLPHITLATVIARMIYNALLDQQFITARDNALARTGSRLLAAEDLATVHRVARATATELIALSPGTAMAVGTPGPDGVLINVSIAMNDDLSGRTLPPAVLENPGAFIPGFAAWRIEPMPYGRVRLLAARRKLPAGMVEAFRALAGQVELSEASRRSHAELDRRANHDHLTQLPNRAKFFSELAAAVDQGPAGSLALLNIDLDEFKQVNDNYGHPAGDELLIQVAQRLTEVAGQTGVAARFGGDEFALLLTELTEPAEAEHLAIALCARLNGPMRLTAATVTVGASIGVAVHEPGVTASALTRRADIAMYSAKARGKSRVELFVPAEHGDPARHRMLESQLPGAIERGEVVVALQPYAHPATGAWTGVEALFQWRHPTLGDVNCRQLLDIAERAGAVHDVTRHVLGVVCARLCGLPGLPVGLNVSARQLLDPRFTDTVLGALAENGTPAGRLVLEVADTDQVDQPVAADQLRRLAEQGVRVALDEFGDGRVSLPALRSLPVHMIKTDARLVQNDPAGLEMVLALAELIGADVVVQGVTGEAEAGRVRDGSAVAMQGSYVSAPVPIDHVAAVMT